MIFFISFLKCTEILLGLAHKPIKIFLINDNKMFISKRLDYFGDSPFELINHEEEINLNKYDSDSQIKKDGPFFQIFIGDTGLCAKENKVILCEDTIDKWSIIKRNIGFVFSINELCISFYDRDLRLEDCSDKNNQLFDFLEIPPIFSCLNEISYDSKKDNLILKKVDDEIIRNEGLQGIKQEKLPVKDINDFIDRTFKNKDDKFKGEKIKKMDKLFKWGKFRGVKFKAKNFIDFMCPR
ncbi:hypothetical protein TUBRATIS_008370 [Tubulinosema ratisbonensis]|uniref:Uncharacterized protein n=1 Tax=Tubulinosema ratisbonensis TaxID=291195 RepID=A0A437ANG3_9MICR|nr:hypothetical protein TUBRATIS_008370 [Tubulinosema ratisbonensis]